MGSLSINEEDSGIEGYLNFSGMPQQELEEKHICVMA